MNLILIPLQPNQPPARRTHAQQRYDTTKHHAQNSISQSASRNDHTQPAGSEHDEEDRQCEMKRPGVVLEVSTEDREEAEDFDAEKSQTEHMCS